MTFSVFDLCFVRLQSDERMIRMIKHSKLVSNYCISYVCVISFGVLGETEELFLVILTVRKSI